MKAHRMIEIPVAENSSSILVELTWVSPKMIHQLRVLRSSFWTHPPLKSCTKFLTPWSFAFRTSPDFWHSERFCIWFLFIVLIYAFQWLNLWDNRKASSVYFSCFFFPFFGILGSGAPRTSREIEEYCTSTVSPGDLFRRLFNQILMLIMQLWILCIWYRVNPLAGSNSIRW